MILQANAIRQQTQPLLGFLVKQFVTLDHLINSVEDDQSLPL